MQPSAQCRGGSQLTQSKAFSHEHAPTHECALVHVQMAFIKLKEASNKLQVRSDTHLHEQGAHSWYQAALSPRRGILCFAQQ